MEHCINILLENEKIRVVNKGSQKNCQQVLFCKAIDFKAKTLPTFVFYLHQELSQ